MWNLKAKTLPSIRLIFRRIKKNTCLSAFSVSFIFATTIRTIRYSSMFFCLLYRFILINYSRATARALCPLFRTQYRICEVNWIVYRLHNEKGAPPPPRTSHNGHALMCVCVFTLNMVYATCSNRRPLVKYSCWNVRRFLHAYKNHSTALLYCCPTSKRVFPTRTVNN